MLTGHAEQVALVVMQDLAIGPCPKQPVAVAAICGLDDHAAGDHRIELLGLGLEPLVGRPILGLGEAFGLHGETGGEHLGKDHQIRFTDLGQQLFEMRIVGLAVVPGQGCLHQGDFQIGQFTQIAHSFSAA